MLKLLKKKYRGVRTLDHCLSHHDDVDRLKRDYYHVHILTELFFDRILGNLQFFHEEISKRSCSNNI